MKPVLFFFILITYCSSSFALTRADQENLKERVEDVMLAIDSPTKFLGNDEFIISMYQQVLGYTPTDAEFTTMKLLLDGYGEEGPLNRSHFVEQLLVIKGEKDFISWEDIDENIDLIESLDLGMKPVIGVYDFRSIEEPSRAEKKKYLKPVSHNGEYQVYFGYLHAHSELSDGRGDAVDAYKMAKEVAQLDYFALTDHSENLHFWPWERKYKKLKSIANEFNEDGRFAALYGFEWSHPILGHFNVVNTERYTSAILRPTMFLLMSWLGRKEGAFGRFNHPGRVNMKYWPYEFMKLKVYNRALNNVVGIEMWNKGDSLREYLEKRGSFREGHNFLDNANLNGWFVGALGGQDNHDADWGMRNDYRVGAWAEGLSREHIVDAYFARRTFATEDKNGWMSYKLGGAQMGSRLIPGSYELSLSFGDAEGERVKHAKLVKKGVVIKEYEVGANQEVTDQVEGVLGDYFYIIAEQEDGDMLLSSPIWMVPQ